jgi:hypothetical protein
MTRTLLLGCGILSSLLYVAANLRGARRWKDYSVASQTVSADRRGHGGSVLRDPQAAPSEGADGWWRIEQERVAAKASDHVKARRVDV